MPDLDGIVVLRNAVRIATSQALATVARLDVTLRLRSETALQRAGFPTPADLRRLSARLSALHLATDRVLREAGR